MQEGQEPLLDEFRQAVELLQRIRERKLYKFVKELTYYVREVDGK